MNSPLDDSAVQTRERKSSFATPQDGASRPVEKRSQVIEELEQIITQDPGGRGLDVDPRDNLVTRCRGNLGRASRHLASEGNAVAIVTGFYVGGGDGPTLETDGPCGAIALAWLLSRQSCAVTLMTDPLGARAIAAGLDASGAGSESVSFEVFPFEDDDPGSHARTSNEPNDSPRSMAFVESFFRSGPGNDVTHLIAVERAGPSHRLDGKRASAAEDWNEFDELCPPEHQNQVHNFRGQIITAHTAKTHLLFDFIRQNHLPIRTIGIGDGGNEIGMGSIPRRVIQSNIPGGLGARIACRVAADWTIACGVSNWGAYALGTAVACLRGRPEVLKEWTDERERAVLAALVACGAVDGVTARSELSVDGMPLEQHLAIWAQIRDATHGECNGRLW